MRLKLAFIFFFISSLLASISAATTTPEDILAKAVMSLKNAQSIEANFVATTPNGASSGSITISGNSFKLITNEVSVWFNGRTQWSYSPSIGEVNISEPTLEEIGQIDPFTVVNSLKSGYKARRLPSVAGYDKIELTPTSKGTQYTNVVLTLNSKTSLPSDIVLTSTDGMKVNIAVNSIKKGGRLSASTFVFNPKLYPAVEVVDLR